MARTVHYVVLVLLMSWPVAAQTGRPKPALLPVSFIRDSVVNADDRVIDLLSGSKWLLSESALDLMASDVVIILTNSKGGLLFHDGEQVSVTYLSGVIVPERGLYGQVVQSMGDGAVLQLNDGSLWEIPEYDRFDTGWWVPPYPVLVTGGGLYLVNLNKGKRVWATQIQR